MYCLQWSEQLGTTVPRHLVSKCRTWYSCPGVTLSLRTVVPSCLLDNEVSWDSCTKLTSCLLAKEGVLCVLCYSLTNLMQSCGDVRLNGFLYI